MEYDRRALIAMGASLIQGSLFPQIAKGVNKLDLSTRYKDYIECLNVRELGSLDRFVHEDVSYNGDVVGLKGYRNMIAGNYRDIPDLYFNIRLLLIQGSYVDAVLFYDCHPRSRFLGLPINGRHISFSENVFYKFTQGKIKEVLSVIDKAHIEELLGIS